MKAPTPTPLAEPRTRHDAGLQAALDLIDQGITLINDDLRMVAWNEGFLRLLDFPREMAYPGAPFESFIRFNAQRGEYGPGDPEEQTALRVAAARNFQIHDLERTRPNGTVLRVRGVPVPGQGFITLYSDITEERRREVQIQAHAAELELRVSERTAALTLTNAQLRQALTHNQAIAESLTRSESRMRLITDSIPALVGYVGRDAHYRYVNRGYAEWFGLDVDHPETISARKYLGDETYDRIRPYVQRAIRGETVTYEYEARTQHRGLRLARTTLIPECTPQGETVGCFELTFDITDERLTQDRMTRAQKMEALGVLTGGLAHDFNNILTVIQGNLGALSDMPALKPYVSTYLQPSIDAARRGTELIRGLLSFARKRPLSQQVEDLNEAVDRTVTLLRSALPDTLHVTLKAPQTATWVRMDVNQFQDALVNLALNARDATQGRGHLLIESQLIELDAAQAQSLGLSPGTFACLCVEDDGCGMDQATLDRLFEPFFSTKAVGQGSGMGMAMVYGFMRQSSGAIDVHSTPGSGTRVRLMFPLQAAEQRLVEADSTEPGEAESSADGAGQDLALLVEDDDAVRHWLRRELLDMGYAVVEAESGDEAMALLAHTPGIRLLLSDVVMPGRIDGVQLVTHARARTDIPRIVLMSGNMQDRAIPDGVGLLQKPFTREELLCELGVSGS
jgi:PAS domain S-box-containing protein